MKPESPAPHLGPENMPTQERAPGAEKPNEPKSPEVSAERFEARAEHNAAAVDTGMASSLPTPVPVVDDQAVDDKTTDDNTITDTPLAAGDDDLIEKEWVDKAKKIVAETKSDPYSREEQVNKLQVDYLRKRYGRELGATD